jgi:hypothetical protein
MKFIFENLFFMRKKVFILLLSTFCLFSWGFWAHKEINKLAVYALPSPLNQFYKQEVDYLSTHAVDPDKRRYILKDEAPRHYLDVEFYGDSIFNRPYISWVDAQKKYTQDSMSKHGVLPWHLQYMTQQLTQAFKNLDTDRILKLSADIGHYIGDLHVPLHTTRNYNGQLTQQNGIHGLWESRLPELFNEQYFYYVGSAVYLPSVENMVWERLYSSHQAVDSVLYFEKLCSQQIPSDRKYTFEHRNNQLVKVYSKTFCQCYHQALNHMIEKRMKLAIHMTASVWYTAWVNAGSPHPIYFKKSTRDLSEDTLSKLNHSTDCVH